MLICRLAVTILPFLEQRQISFLVDNLITYVKSDQSPWITTFVIFIIIRFVKIVFLHLDRLSSRIQQYRQDNEMAKLYTKKTSSLDYQQLEDKNIVTLMSKVNEEYRWRSRQIFGDINELISQAAGFATILVFLFPRYWYIGIILMFGEIPGMIIDNIWGKKDNSTFEKHIEKTRFASDINWQLVDKKYISELRVNHAINWLWQKSADAFNAFVSERVSNRLGKFLPDLIASTMSISSGLFCLFLIIQEIRQNHLTIGMFTFYFSIVRSTGDYFAGIFNRYNSISEQLHHLNNFRKIIELKNTINNGHYQVTKPASPHIEFRNVSFKYPGSSHYVFKNFNLIITPNEEIAIVGENGAGKSTLIKLICRFYDPTEGDIFVNGRNLKDYTLDNWYRHLSLLTQEFNTFQNLSLRDNIVIGHPQLKSDKKVISSLKKTEAYEFISRYSNGLDTMMSHRYGGEEPSWGQWQKIAIARVFYRNSPIMILDEPTASIDAVAESKIFSRLYSEIKGKTLIIVSHRFSTVRNAQRIIVIKDGQIIEQGNHESLLKLHGQYAHSFNLQAQGYST